MRIPWLLLLLPLLFAAAVHADEAPPPLPRGGYTVFFELREAKTNALLAGEVVAFEFSLNGFQEKRLATSDKNGLAKVYLDAGAWSVKAESDKPNTPGKDFVGFASLNVSGDARVLLYMQPVGSIRGEIVDEEGKSVGVADAGVDCVNAFYDLEPLVVDSAGRFFAKHVPTGACTVYASSGGKTGSVDVDLKQGELENVRIVLSQAMATGSDLVFVVLGAAALLAVAGAFYYFLKPGRKRGETPKERREPAGAKPSKPLGGRARDVLKTLNAKEKRITEFLLEKGKTKQSVLYKELLIPKASLSRALKNLERKGVVELQRVGKVNRVKLTKWFKGG